jgi:signal transduction histidine kinase
MRKFLPAFLFFSLISAILPAQNKDSLLSAFNEASLSRNNKMIFGLAHQLGLYYEKQNDADSVVYYFSICEKRASTPYEKADAEYHMGRANMLSNPNYSVAYAKKAFEIAKDSVAGVLKTNSANLIGIYYSRNGKYDSSLYYYNIALTSAQKLHNEMLLIKVKSNLGDVYSYLGEYSKALYYQLDALASDQRIKDSVAMYRMIVNVGNTYSYMGDDSLAMIYLMRAYPYYKDSRSRVTGNLYNSLARVYDELAMDSGISVGARSGLLAKEKFFLEQSLSIKTELHDSIGIGNTLSNFGRLEHQLHHFPEAEKYFLQSVDLAKMINNPRLARTNYVELGDLYREEKQYNKALTYLLLMNESGEHDGDISSRSDALKRLYQAYGEMGDYKNAFVYLEKYKKLAESINTAENVKQMKDAEAKYKNKEQLQVNEKLKVENQLKTAQQEKAENEKKLVLIFSITGLVLLVFIFLLIYRNVKIKAKAEEEKQVTKAIFESEQKERIRISRDLHDNVGTQLSLISNDIEWIAHPVKAISEKEKSEKLELIGNASKDVINTLRETIWALNKEEVSFEEFADKLKAHVQKQVKLSKNVKPSFSENLENNIQLGPFEALGLFRICQEAIANSLKYAQAEILDISLNAANEKYELVIADNGKGFNPGETDKNRYGLANMKFRAEEIACSLRIESAYEKGTKVIISKK